MNRIERTRLWQISIGVKPDNDQYAEARERLRQALMLFRKRAKIIASLIAEELPEFTVHDITHIDALWELADLIGGEDLELTPTEAFVLGGAFLIHDLGLGLAALPGGREKLREDALWADLASSRLKSKLGRFPTSDNLKRLDKEIEIEVLTTILRLRHAEWAEWLVAAEYKSTDGDQIFHLIEDPELREAYSEIIGSLARSHWNSIEQVRKEFAEKAPLGPPALLDCPGTWTVDRLKLACLLRVADAAHLDARRAPGFLRALRRPAGESDLHWRFQSTIGRCQLGGNRLVFTSGRPFNIEDADAWWVGYDLLRTCDEELRGVDALLQDLEKKYRFAARSVAGVEASDRLRKHIPTKGWIPVLAKVHVSDVAALVRRLGGKELYGDDPFVPLRELLQNASDAIRARRLLEERPAGWGRVTVRVGTSGEDHYLEVEDNGVGMSAEVLTGPLLDFGTSYWDSDLMREELPGLTSRSFEATGKYGIGFFSLFMWSPRVVVVTRRFNRAPSETQVLDFSAGLARRPHLREPRKGENILEGGTRVRVLFDDSPLTSEGVLQSWRGSIEELCKWLCPAIDFNLYTEDSAGNLNEVVKADDWLTMPAADLLIRVAFEYPKKKLVPIDELENVARRVRYLTSVSGDVIGRAAFNYYHSDRYSLGGVLVVGGFRAMGISDVCGVVMGRSIGASRIDTEPLFGEEDEELVEWATSQASLIAEYGGGERPEILMMCADTIRRWGGDTGQLPIAYSSKGWLKSGEIEIWGKHLNQVFLVEVSFGENASTRSKLQWKEEYASVSLNENVLFVENATRLGFPQLLRLNREFIKGAQWRRLLNSRTLEEERARGWWPFNCWRLGGAVVEALAGSWSVTVEEVVAVSNLPYETDPCEECKIGTSEGEAVVRPALIVNRPVDSRS